MNPLLEIKNLKTYFETRNGTVKAVDGVSIAVNKGNTLGIVGESGCGKTVLALSIMRLIPSPPGRIAGGEIFFDRKDILTLPEDQMRKLRGKEISMIFQEPMNSLNPVLRIGDQLTEAIQLHMKLSRKDAITHALDSLKLVGMPSAEERLKNYPHQMSGGMRQRVMIAMALSCNPKLMLADEPTTALDVTIQAQVLNLINDLKEKMGTSVILITHDLGIIAESSQFVAVMYAGKIVEYCSTETLFSLPRHPYTEGLMASTPRLNGTEDNNGFLNVIPGLVPNLYELPSGCSFHDRCPYVMDICREEQPELLECQPNHFAACWKNS